MKTWRITDKYNPDKIWIIKRYNDGHYVANQEISGKLFYKSFQRITKDRWSELIKED